MSIPLEDIAIPIAKESLKRLRQQRKKAWLKVEKIDRQIASWEKILVHVERE